jgi:eukaryotic-like serine/threonine-protein kinase
VLADRYKILRALGEGSMGSVHLAEDVSTGQRVALKVLQKADDELAGRLLREATATTAIDHPNVARAIATGKEADGVAWLAIEYVDGRSLRDILGAGALDPIRALKIARQVLLALDAAHAKGVVHRDIKPENVMLIAGESFDDEVVKVLDFGIAKLDDRHVVQGPSTNAGVVYGTPTYMAPEQIKREPVDPRTDLYALGAMLFEMIAGAPPFDGDDVTVLSKHITLVPPPLSSPIKPEVLTLAVRAFVARLLAKKPDGRFSHAAAAIEALDEAIGTIATERPLHTGSLAVLSMPPPRSDPTHTPLQKKTAKFVAFAKSYGLTPQQLLFAFAVAFALIIVVTVVALST